MIPIELQRELKKKMDALFKDTLLLNPDGEYVALNIFEQHLPKRNKNDIDPFPYLIIKLMEGEQSIEGNPQQVQVMFIVGIYDEQNTFRGYQDVSSILQKIMSNIQRNPRIANRFELKYPIRWAYHDEDVFPYYFGAVETFWEIPTSIREDVEVMI